MINKAKTDEWPGGEAWMINAALIKKYIPDDIIAADEARRRLNDVSMKRYDDPAILFEQLAEIEVAYAGTTIKITEQDCIGVVFATAAEKYHSILTSEQRTKGAGLTMDDLEDAMNQLWRQGGGSQKKIQEMMEVKWCCQPLEVPATTAKRRDTEQINVPRKMDLIMDTATQVAIPEESSKGSVTTAARSVTRNPTVGSLRKIRTSARRTISKEMQNTETLRSAVVPETKTRTPSFLCVQLSTRRKELIRKTLRRSMKNMSTTKTKHSTL
jgi:hypothetical protein